jgi:hypothetical protein
MRTSIEKINDLAVEFQRAPDADAPPVELAIRSSVMMVWPMLEGMLPDDPAVVDEGLEVIARQLLSLRSDGAGELVIEGSVAELPAGDG